MNLVIDTEKDAWYWFDMPAFKIACARALADRFIHAGAGKGRLTPEAIDRIDPTNRPFTARELLKRWPSPTS